MLTDNSWNSLRKLLDLVEELVGLSDQEGPPRRSMARKEALLRQLRMRTGSAQLKLLPRPLSRLALRHDLAPRDVALIFCLIHRRLAAADPVLSGRELLRLAGASSADLLLSDRTLRRGAPILRGGLVVTDGEGLDGRFRINEEFFGKLLHAAGGGSARPRQGVFQNDHDHFMALREFVLLHERRAALIFPWSCWRDIHPEPGFDEAELSRRIKTARAALARRETRSGKTRIPWLKARSEHGLPAGSDEEVILAALAQHALFTALPPFTAGDLVRLVAASTDDAINKREVLGVSGILRSHLLVEVETDTDAGDPAAPVILSANARDAFLPSTPAPPPDAAERRRFHDYMEQLQDSTDFFRRLR